MSEQFWSGFEKRAMSLDSAAKALKRAATKAKAPPSTINYKAMKAPKAESLPHQVIDYSSGKPIVSASVKAPKPAAAAPAHAPSVSPADAAYAAKQRHIQQGGTPSSAFEAALKEGVRK